MATDTFLKLGIAPFRPYWRRLSSHSRGEPTPCMSSCRRKELSRNHAQSGIRGAPSPPTTPAHLRPGPFRFLSPPAYFSLPPRATSSAFRAPLHDTNHSPKPRRQLLLQS